MTYLFKGIPLRTARALLIGLAGLTTAPPGLADDGWIQVVGTATELEGDKVLYTEHHWIRRVDGQPREHQVRYRNPDGELIATKQVRYPHSPAAPAFTMRDLRHGTVEGGEYADDRYWLFKQEGAQAKRKREAMPLAADLVVDAGFDGFVRQNIEALNRGEQIDFRLGVAGSLRTFDFRARKTGEREQDGRRVIDIRVEPDSMLRWFVDPLELVYSAQPIQLLQYRGRTNIAEPDGDSRYDAVIRFGPETPGSAPEPLPSP